MEHSSRGGKRKRRVAIASVIAVAGACALAAPSLASGNGAKHATASIIDGTGEVVGSARFTEDAGGTVHVNVHVHGLTPGLHGIHIHSIGVCTPAAFASAGSHHNPLGAAHGSESTAPVHPHAGDLPNLEVNAAGVGHLDAKTDLATLSPGTTNILDGNGSALVIHAAEDDLMTDPTGNSGARIACGVIEG